MGVSVGVECVRYRPKSPVTEFRRRHSRNHFRISSAISRIIRCRDLGLIWSHIACSYRETPIVVRVVPKVKSRPLSPALTLGRKASLPATRDPGNHSETVQIFGEAMKIPGLHGKFPV
jgi:hypothetical protein